MTRRFLWDEGALVPSDRRWRRADRKRRHEAQFDVALLEEGVLMQLPHLLDVTEEEKKKEDLFDSERQMQIKLEQRVWTHLMSTSLNVVSMAHQF